MSDEDILNFLSEKVTSDIDRKGVEIVRSKKNASAIVPGGLRPDSVKVAINNLDFSTTKTSILRLPLYCRPIRDLTPEKSNSKSHVTDFESTSTLSCKIPGLPPRLKNK